MNDLVDSCLNAVVKALAPVATVSPLDVNAVAAITLVCFASGLVGSLVVGNRMAFFSDAMAHTAFAGVATGILVVLLVHQPKTATEAQQHFWLVPLVTIGLGLCVGAAMEFLRERTGLTNDTVIGVFFAAAIGFAVTVMPSVKRRTGIDPDLFLFGSPLFVSPAELVTLIVLAGIVSAVIVWKYNALAFGVVSPPLARSRGLSVRFGNYLFLILLALVVNVSIRAVGVLLMNAILIVPAAAAANIATNARSMFRLTLLLSVLSGWVGYVLSVHAEIPLPTGGALELSPGGSIVLTAVALFAITLIVGAVHRRFGFDQPRKVHVHPDGDPAGCCGV